MSEEIVVEQPTRFEIPAEASQSDTPEPSVSATEPKVEETTTTEPIKADESPKSDNPDQPEKQPKPGKNSFERKIDRLYKSAAEQKARADLLEKQLEELKPKPQVSADGLKLEDFEFDVEKYAEAKAKKAEELALKRYTEEQQSQNFKKLEQNLVSSWEEKTTKAVSKYDDFDEVVGELKPVTPLNVAIMQAENGEEIAYYLGSNMKEAQRIAQLDPISAIREIGRLEAKFVS